MTGDGNIPTGRNGSDDIAGTTDPPATIRSSWPDMPVVSPADDDGLTGSRAATVSAALRQLIITGEIPPGQRIRARELTERFGVSHIPVREAMRSLEGEGLIRYHAQRGAVATEASLDELREIYELRRYLECRSVALAAKSYDDEYLARISDALDDLDEARSADPRAKTFFDAHHQFHWLLLQPGCSPLVSRMLRHLWSAADRYVYLGMEDKEPSRSGNHHRLLLEAAETRNPGHLSDMIDEHLRITEAAVLERVQHLVTDG